MKRDDREFMETYLQSCQSDFWKKVFKAELEYLLQRLNGNEKILSIGCGPAIIESGLAEHGFNVTGLDVSVEALGCAPDNIRTIIGTAEDIDIDDGSFDAVIFVASLQFVNSYQQAVQEAFRVLRADGKVLIMLLNPQSGFYKEKMESSDSYIRQIKHTNIKNIEHVVSTCFSIEAEYVLGVEGMVIFESHDPQTASLYVITGTKSTSGDERQL